jgi:nicotinamidase-related amidase
MKSILWVAAFVLMAAVTATVAVASPDGPEKEKAQRMRPALLVIDVQNQYLDMMSDEDRDVAMWMINATIALFRENGFPIIRIYNTDPQYGPSPGTEAFEFPSSVLVTPDDPQIVKEYSSAFKKTDLEKMLRDKECNTLFMCGLSAVGCVLATRYSAIDRDFDTFLVKDALLSHDVNYTNTVEDIFDAVGYGAVKAMLENAQK